METIVKHIDGKSAISGMLATLAGSSTRTWLRGRPVDLVCETGGR